MCALVAVGVFRCQLQPHSQIMWPKKLLGFRCFISFHFIFCLEVYSCLSRLMYIMPNLFYSRVECSAEGNRPYLLKLSIPSPIPCPCPCPCLFSNPKLARRSGFQFFSYARCRLRFMVFESFHSGWRTRSKKPFSCFSGRFVRQRRLIKKPKKKFSSSSSRNNNHTKTRNMPAKICITPDLTCLYVGQFCEETNEVHIAVSFIYDRNRALN